MLERRIERAQPRATHGFHVQLEFAARFIEGRRSTHLDLHAVLRLPVVQLRFMPEHHAAHLGLRVLQREVAVAGRRAHEVGNLAADPHQRQIALDEFLGAPVEFGNADYARRFFVRRKQIHAAILALQLRICAPKNRQRKKFLNRFKAAPGGCGTLYLAGFMHRCHRSVTSRARQTHKARGVCFQK